MTVHAENPENKTEPTEAELKAYRENMKKYYEEQIPLLKKQKEYEGLLADIEESRAKRLTMTVRIAQIMAGPPEPEGQDEPQGRDNPEGQNSNQEQRPVRQLKKEGEQV